ncbi:MAG: S-layer homology domain-containing protein [Clostridia bacterium]|nr:S-layer homology domain-containing protein [Clostridia bacterium]
MKRRLLCFLLCFSFLFALMPLPAQATFIPYVEVGITRPVVGGRAIRYWNGNIEVPEDAPYEGVFVSYWRDEYGNEINDENYRFEANRTYSIKITVHTELADGFTTATKMRLKDIPTSAYSVRFDNCINGYLSYVFTFRLGGTTTDTTIDTLRISGIGTPQVLGTPAEEVTVTYNNTNGYHLSWRGEFDADGRFRDGWTYTMKLTVYAVDGYKFATDGSLDVTIDGKRPDYISSIGRAVTLTSYYTLPPSDIIGSVCIEGLWPTAGSYAHPLKSGQLKVPSDANYKIDDITYEGVWHDENGKAMTSNDPFISGRKYSYTVFVSPKNPLTHKFSTDTAGYLSHHPFDAYSAKQVAYKDYSKEYTLGFTYTILSRPATDSITDVSVFEIDVPKAGRTPDMHFALGSAGYYLYPTDGMTWTEDGYSMNPTDTFREGHRYAVSIWLQAKPGYEFATGVTGNPSVSARFNGESIKVNRAYEQDPSDVIELFCDFGTLHTHQMTAIARLEPTCTEDGQEAHYLCVTCGKFFADAAGSTQIDPKTWGAIPAPGHTGGTATVTELAHCDVCGSPYGEYATHTHEYYSSAQLWEHWKECAICGDIIDLEYHQLNEYGKCEGCGFIDPMASPFTDVSSSAYYYEPVLWAVAYDITTGTSATTFSPDATCSRAQAVTFLWRATGSPDPSVFAKVFADVPTGAYYEKAVKWAVGSSITNGTSATTFSPNTDCSRAQIVTLLWRMFGCPEVSGKNPFTDVPANAYYYDAVMWAVERGITNGTSATTFSPNTVCTRGQIVTFLFRAISGE